MRWFTYVHHQFMMKFNYVTQEWNQTIWLKSPHLFGATIAKLLVMWLSFCRHSNYSIVPPTGITSATTKSNSIWNNNKKQQHIKQCTSNPHMVNVSFSHNGNSSVVNITTFIHVTIHGCVYSVKNKRRIKHKNTTKTKWFLNWSLQGLPF